MKRPEEIQAYPLCWPDGWPRTPPHVRDNGARFKSGDGYSGYGDQRQYVGKRMITFDRARRPARHGRTEATVRGRPMSRLPRPNTPVEVRCRVVLRQLGEMWPDQVIEVFRMKPGDPYLKGIGVRVPRLGLGKLLALKLDQLTELLCCGREDLRLDHDPALENREKLIELPSGRRVRAVVVPRGGRVLRFFPDANDQDFLFYRPHGTQFAGSHDVKTRIRGDCGQLSDNALAKKERRRLRKLDPNRRRAKIPNRKKPWPKGRKLRGRPFPKRKKP